MKRRKVFIITMVVFAGLLSTFSFYFYQVIRSPNLQVDKQSFTFLIPKNASFRSVQDTLYKYRVVTDMVSFSFLAKLMGYQEAVKAGLYTIEPNMTNIAAIRVLRAGEQTPSKVTFSNARLIEDLYEPISRYIELTPEQFEQAVDRFIAENTGGFTRETIIGMFIPNTYQVYYTVEAEVLVERLYMEYQKFWTPENLRKAEAIGLTPKEISTLASIVQAESTIGEESPIIAGLYINRLKKGIPLQADPTLVFAVGDFSLKRVLNEHKQVESPYNTYKNRGLPPGPINMPSIRSLNAVLNYERHDYIFMCAKEDFSGYHNFTASLRVHNENARRYQRALSLEQQKARRLNQN